jgi:hypothetical protein
MRDPVLTRRDLLKAGAATGALALGSEPGAALLAGTRPRPRAVERVILVALSGGVRTRETLGTPANVPNLVRMAAEGMTYSRARTSNLGHFGATLSLFTGIAEPRGIRENSRGASPTVFEYVRKGLGLSSSEVWISTSGGAQQANYSYSLHPDYGQTFGANTVDGDGIFNQDFRQIVAAYGKPREMSAREGELLTSMRAAIGGVPASPEDGAAPRADVERYLLQELASGTTDLRGTGASDAKALRVSRNLLAVFRPRLLGIVLQDADVAHGNFNAYVEVIRRNDAMIGELWQAVRSDPELAETTAIFVLPEFGRDADLNSRRGLDHGDASDDLNYVSIVAWGAGIRRGGSVQEEVQVVDVCPTICSVLGVDAPLARGRSLPKLRI